MPVSQSCKDLKLPVVASYTSELDSDALFVCHTIHPELLELGPIESISEPVLQHVFNQYPMPSFSFQGVPLVKGFL